MGSIKPLVCEQANQIDLVVFLEKSGHHPQKINGNDYWYLSPLRQEKTASFKVNRKLNLWYDHGNGKGGTLVDFGILYFNCSVKDFISKLQDEKELIVSFQSQRTLPAVEKKETDEAGGKIKIISSYKISHPELINYLQQRKIPLTLAKEFCQEICFELYDKRHLAIGFKNNSGGYELRSQNFKGSSFPKQPKLIRGNGAKDLAVFEGFFSFLSFQTLQKSSQPDKPELPTMQSDFLILNSLSFFEKSRYTMEQYSGIHLFLDRDKMGMEYTKQALQWSPKYKDQSQFYKQFKDLNEFVIKNNGLRIKQSQHRRLRL